MLHLAQSQIGATKHNTNTEEFDLNEKELQIAFNSLKANKASGFDDISSKVKLSNQS